MKPDDALRQLRAADPAPPERVHGAASRPEAREALDRILDEERTVLSRRPPRRAPLAIAAGVVALAIVVTAVVTQPSEDLEGSTARLALSQAARTAAGRAIPPLAGGEYLYRRTDLIRHITSVAGRGTWTALVPIEREVWIASDGSGRIREVPGSPSFPGPRDRRLWRRSGKPRFQLPASDRLVGPGRLAPDVAELSTDPEALTSVLMRRNPDSDLPPNVSLFVACSDLLSEPLVDPELRSSLYRVVAGIDGVRLLGEVRDPSGRVGVGVAVTYSSEGPLTRRVLIFSEQTSEVLAERVVVLERVDWVDADPPITTDSRVYGSSSVVPFDHARPAGD